MFEALDVIRMCVLNAGCVEDKVTVLQFFFRGKTMILALSFSQYESSAKLHPKLT